MSDDSSEISEDDSKLQAPEKSPTAIELLESLGTGQMFDTSTSMDEVASVLNCSINSDIFNESVMEDLLSELDSQEQETDTGIKDNQSDISYAPSSLSSDDESSVSEAENDGSADGSSKQQGNTLPETDTGYTGESDRGDRSVQQENIPPEGDKGGRSVQQENIPPETDTGDCYQTPKKRSKKAKPESWKQNMRKSQREKGEAYEITKSLGGTNHKVVKKGRSLKARCTCKKTESRQCSDITEEERNTIFNKVWKNMHWDERKIFVKGLVDAVPIQRKRTATESSRRVTTFRYHLKQDGVRKQICKKMFLATTGLGSWSVQNWASAVNPTNTPVKARSEYYSRSEEGRVFMRTEFLGKLPKLPSHYCRASASKMYLEPNIPTMTDLHKLYNKNV